MFVKSQVLCSILEQEAEIDNWGEEVIGWRQVRPSEGVWQPGGRHQNRCVSPGAREGRGGECLCGGGGMGALYCETMCSLSSRWGPLCHPFCGMGSALGNREESKMGRPLTETVWGHLIPMDLLEAQMRSGWPDLLNLKKSNKWPWIRMTRCL